MQISQFTSQYLLSTKKVLEEKRDLINEALETFALEEDMLDLKIVKLR